MVAVLRGHLYLERAIFALLVQSEPDREKHFKKLKFSNKVDALEAKGIVAPDVIGRHTCDQQDSQRVRS
jgi:hypothetical protein